MVFKQENWRWLTPIFGLLNFVGIMIVGIIGFFMIRTIDQFDKHLERIDVKFDSQEARNTDFEHRITLVQGQCCKRSINQLNQESLGG